MRDRHMTFPLVGKLLFAAFAVVALVALPVKELVPGISLDELLLYCAAGVAGALVLLMVGAVCSLQFSQFSLRMGGTDSQWSWFFAEPKGLAALRKGQTLGKAMRDES